MKEPVKFPIAKLLKEKGFFSHTLLGYSRLGEPFSAKQWDHFQNSLNDKTGNNNVYSAPTIGEVVMWLYEKHRVWIMVDMTGSKRFYPRGRMIDKNGKHHVGDFKDNGKRLYFNSPTEAYEAAIEHTLNNLL